MRKSMRVAAAICTLVILFSTYMSARRNMEQITDSAYSAFIEGTDGSGYSIYTDLQNRAALSHNLYTVASRYIDTDESAMKDLKKAAKALEGEKSPEKAYDANCELEEAVIEIDRMLSDCALTDTDESYRIGILTDLNSYAAAISHDPYNDYVKSIGGDSLSEFPANIWRLITFTGTVEYFN